MTNQTFDLISTDKNLNPETQIALIMAQCQYRLELLVQRPRFLQFIPLGMVGKRSKMMQIRVSKSSRRKVSLRKSQKSFDEVVYHLHRINQKIHIGLTAIIFTNHFFGPGCSVPTPLYHRYVYYMQWSEVFFTLESEDLVMQRTVVC